MKIYNRGGLAMALASTQFAASYVPNPLLATAFSLNVQKVHAAAGYSSTATQRSMSKMNQSFETWSFDEPCKTMAWNELSKASFETATKTDDWDEESDLVIVGVFAPKKDEEEDEDGSDDKEEEEPTVTLEGGAQSLDEKLGGALSSMMLENAKEFNHGATAGSMTPTFRTFNNGKSQRVVVMGLGTVPGEDGISGVGSAVGKALATLCDKEKKAKTAKILIPDSVGSDDATLKDFSTAFYTGLYADNRFRTGKKVTTPAEDLETVTVVTEGASINSDALEAGKKEATGVYMTKDIVNGPHNVLNSVSLAATAKRIAEESGGVLKCTILGKKECEERGMGAYLGVARASETEPQFIHLTYTPPDGKVNKKIGIVGKGLLFDTGGYNIKTQMMELMKFDCGGAAAVLGTFVR
jgi:leucyl aminopeptidase